MNETEGNSINEYLKEGDYSIVTPEITNILKDIPGEGLEYLEKVNTLMQKNLVLKYGTADRYSRDSQAILFNSQKELNKDKNGGILIGGCTESARLLRTASLFKQIPSRLIETVSTEWLNLAKPQYIENPNAFRGHVFVEVFIDGEWFVINHTIYSPTKRENPKWIGKRNGNKIKLGNSEEFEIVCEGVDHMNMKTPEGDSVKFLNNNDFHSFIRKRYFERWKKIAKSKIPI